MLTAMKILIERQVEKWQGNGSAVPAKISGCGFRPSATRPDQLNRLQNGSCVLSATSGEVALDLEEPVDDLPIFKMNSRALLAQDRREDAAHFFQEVGIEIRGKLRFPEQNPLTLEQIDWEEEISRSVLQNLSSSSARQAQVEILSQDAKLNRLVHLMMLAIRSGNISLAMMLFAHVETRTANQMTQVLMKKVQELQDQKRKLTQDIQNQKNDAEGNKKLQSLQNEVSQANDDIAVLQTFIRDVAQNKQASIELANAFISKEHETTMAVVRSFGR